MPTKPLVFAALFVVSSVVAVMPPPRVWSGPTTVVTVGGFKATNFCRGLRYRGLRAGSDSAACLCECFKRGYDWYSLQHYDGSTHSNNVCSCGGGPLTKPAPTPYY